MDQRSGGLPRGKLWSITIPNGSLSACVRPAATTEIRARPVGSDCRLRQPSRARLCDREHQGRPARAGAGVPNVSRWAKFAVLKMVSKVVEKPSRKWDSAASFLEGCCKLKKNRWLIYRQSSKEWKGSCTVESRCLGVPGKDASDEAEFSGQSGSGGPGVSYADGGDLRHFEF